MMSLKSEPSVIQCCITPIKMATIINIFNILGAMLSIVQVLSHLILTIILLNLQYSYTHSVGEKTEAWDD